MSIFERYLTVWVFLCIVAGIGVTLFVNWLVKPFSMASLGWLFIRPRELLREKGPHSPNSIWVLLIGRMPS